VRRRGRGVASIVLGGAVGAGLFVAVFGAAALRPTNLGWLMRHDTQTYVLAFHHFRREPWQWPPGAVRGVGHPVGTSIGNADAMPLAALPLKPFHGLLPDPLQFLGLWLLACFALQGVFGALLVARFTAAPVLQVLGAAMFVQTPALIARTGHTALCAHWLLLAALWLSLAREAHGRGAGLAPWLLVCAAAAATQPYLLVLVLGLAVADRLRAWRAGGPATRALRDVGATAGVVAAVLWLCGYFLVGSTADYQLEGVGFYSMNLLGPLIPLGHSVWLPELPTATPGQYEGFVYFGVGWLALSATAAGLLAARRSALPRLGPGWLAVAGFLVLAIGPVVTLGSRVLLDLLAWSPPQLAVFRSSGRFGWLPMYVVFTVALAAIVRALPRRAAAAVLAAAVAVQAVDLSGQYGRLRARAHDPAWTEWRTPLADPAWAMLVASHAHLVMAPPDMCAGVWAAPVGPHLPFSLLAGLHGATVNSGNAGRYDVGGVLRACAALRADLDAGQLRDDSLYVLSPPVRAQLGAATTVPLACGVLDGFDVCATAASYERWRAAAVRAGMAIQLVHPAGR
jgi:hypothetical protein